MHGLSILLLSFAMAQTTVFAADCTLTPPMPKGSHYKPGAPLKVNVSQGLTVSGRVLSVTKCKPIARAKIDHWQANIKGYYQDSLRARLFSDADGRYSFETEWPGTSIPHIHFIVSAEGFRTLTTQWVGDEANSKIKIDFVLEPGPGD